MSLINDLSKVNIIDSIQPNNCDLFKLADISSKLEKIHAKILTFIIFSCYLTKEGITLEEFKITINSKKKRKIPLPYKGVTMYGGKGIKIDFSKFPEELIVLIRQYLSVIMK